GIRDDLVTGVQTCALPICEGEAGARPEPSGESRSDFGRGQLARNERARTAGGRSRRDSGEERERTGPDADTGEDVLSGAGREPRSEEHTSELQSPDQLVCR